MAKERCPVHDRVVDAPIPKMWDSTGHADCEFCQKAPSPSIEAKLQQQKTLLAGTDKAELKDAQTANAAAHKTIDGLKSDLEKKDSELQAALQENARLKQHIETGGAPNA